ncbi:hypothetical protein [Pseudomonas guariconensis]|uniref:Uncharacterized protein n=1 Tax=Pseudomonas guariconensis TaxID=1288410 RepID=A0AAX0VQN7_9PSED|nr:hypothetical protein [Pseudomonas guariconensis]PLV14383.1 hypothetical protein CXG49_23085 [Pseudomonas guariconensis]PLV21674.1 hypothetical protein CXG53_23545 [Pseudomonas guariconensis]PLV26794.1 hypothetical protein CXG51_23540 [Pseudomonas guariconensis]
MSTRLPLYRMLDAPLSLGSDSPVSFNFRADHYLDPGVTMVAQHQYAIGKDSDWNPAEHALVVQCLIERASLLEAIFGPEGVATAEAEVLLALEWASADSCWRTLGAVHGLLHDAKDADVVLEIELKPGTVRGCGVVSVQAFLGRHASEFVPGYAHQSGARLGPLAQPIEIIIDGDGSLFPVVEEPLGAAEPLWELKACWSDPQDEPFSSEYVALVLNSTHPHFDQLRDRRALNIEQSPLMRQVFAAWLALVIVQVKEDMGTEFDTFLDAPEADEGIGSIADAVRSFIRLGDL